MILRAGRKVFESAKVDSIISFISKRTSCNLEIIEYENNDFVPKRTIDKHTLLTPFALDYLFSENLKILLKIEESKTKLEDIATCDNACATSDAYKLSELVKSSSEDICDSAKYFRIINTGTIGKYRDKWGEKQMTYLGKKYTRPVVEKQLFLESFTNSYGRKASLAKLIIKGLNLLDACMDANGTIIPGKTTLIITADDVQKLKLLATIVNSKLVFYYLKERYPAASYNQGTSFTKDMINQIPLPLFNDEIKEQLIECYDRIIANIDRSNEFDSETLKIDSILYQQYNLDQEEIKIIEESTK
jgi:hypothetical protein